MLIIRNATMEDVPRLLEIYGYYVENTAVTFEYEVPTEEDFAARIAQVQKRYPYLILEDGGQIKGFAFAAPLRTRAAYDWAVETTIYLDHDALKNNYGRILYKRLEFILKRMRVLNMYACIAYPQVEDEYLTTNSAEFHKHMGFETTAQLHKCGYKFGRWYDIIWAEKIIGEHVDEQPSVIDYPHVKVSIV